MEVTSAIDITHSELQTVRSLLTTHLANTIVWVYGSRLKWTSAPHSDLDLVVFTTPRQRPIVGALQEEFDESNLPFRVDLLVWDELPQSFRDEIRSHYAVLNPSLCRSNGWKETSVETCIEMKELTYLTSDKSTLVNCLDTGGMTENRISRIQDLEFGRNEVPTRDLRPAKAGDTVYNTVRRNKRHFRLVESPQEALLVATDSSVFHGKHGVADTRFIYWFLTQDRIVEQLHGIAEHSTSAYPSIRQSDIGGLTIALPALPEQRNIAHILSTLDANILLNRRMNETLEAMVLALFKSWFVDFDPVCAKIESRDTGLPSHLSDLFPDRLVDSEMGLVPEDWTHSLLGEHAGLRREGVDPEELYRDHPYVGLEHMPRQSVALNNWGKAESIKNRKFSFRSGDILYGQLWPYFHRVGIVPADGICSTDILVLRPKTSHWSAYIVACMLSSDFAAFTDRTSTGTNPRTNWKSMSTYTICQPTDVIARAFQAAVSPMLSRIVENVHQSRALATLRDTLLPKLVSGEIRVQEAQESLQAIS